MSNFFIVYIVYIAVGIQILEISIHSIVTVKQANCTSDIILKFITGEWTNYTCEHKNAVVSMCTQSTQLVYS